MVDVWCSDSVCLHTFSTPILLFICCACSICDKLVSFVICSVVEYPLGEVYVVHGLLKAASCCLCWLFWTIDCM